MKKHRWVWTDEKRISGVCKKCGTRIKTIVSEKINIRGKNFSYRRIESKEVIAPDGKTYAYKNIPPCLGEKVE